MAITIFDNDTSGTALKRFEIFHFSFFLSFSPLLSLFAPIVGRAPNFAFSRLQKGIPTDSAQFANTAPFEVSLSAGRSHWKSLSVGEKLVKCQKCGTKSTTRDSKFRYAKREWILFSSIFYFFLYLLLLFFYFIPSIINIPMPFQLTRTKKRKKSRPKRLFSFFK